MLVHDRAKKAIPVHYLPCTFITTYHLLRNGTQDAKSFTAAMVRIKIGAFYVQNVASGETNFTDNHKKILTKCGLLRRHSLLHFTKQHIDQACNKHTLYQFSHDARKRNC